MTMTTPCRRMTLHFSQIALTLGRTFIARPVHSPGPRARHVSTARPCPTWPGGPGPAPPVPTPRRRCGRSLVPVRDPPSTQVIRCDLHLHAIAREDADPVHPHLARAVGQYFVAVLELHPEHGVGQRLDNRPF